MAATSRNCVGIDIGSTSIRAAQLEMGKAGPRIVALLEQPLKLDAGMSENQRQQATAKQLAEMLKAGGVKTKDAVFCVSGQSVFVRRIKLPRATPEKMTRMVRFAAREEIPFPLDKTAMQFQVFESEGSNESHVLLVAVKNDYIESFMKLLGRIGMRTVGISVSTLALYNFHELNDSSRDLIPGKKAAAPPKKEKPKPKPKKGRKKKGEPEPDPELEIEEASEPDIDPMDALGFDEIKAYVNLGAAVMDLAIPTAGAERMVGFTRSVPLGGNEMDRAIRDKLGLDSIDEARRIKETETAVLSTDFEIAGDTEDVNVEASEAVTTVSDRLIGELRRSLDYFISQPDGVAVDKVVLSGGLSRLKYFGSYVEEKMGIPVESAAPHHEQLRVPDTLLPKFSSFAVATGLGLQGLGIAQNTIDFLPEDLKNVRGMREKRNELVIMFVMLLVVIGLSLGIGEGAISSFNAQRIGFDEQVAKYNNLSKDIAEADKRNGTVADAYAKVTLSATNRNYWFEFLKEVQAKRPAGVLIDDISMRMDGYVLLEGKAPNQGTVTEFVRSLKEIDGGPGRAKIFEVVISDLNSAARDPRFINQVVPFKLRIRTYLRSPRLLVFGEEPDPNAGTPK